MKAQILLQISYLVSLVKLRLTLSPLLLSPRSNPTLRTILQRRSGFNHRGNFLGRHAPLDHLPLQLDF